MITRFCVWWLSRQLKKDSSFWYSYQSNIAMAIYDGVTRYFPITIQKSSPTLNEFCNICANDFLRNWTGDILHPIEKGR
jgi:hypothetical protein